MAKKHALLPRPLSWSGLDLWERNPEEYKDVYFKGYRKYENDAMRFGKHIANVLCGKEKPKNHIEQSVKLLAKGWGNQETEIKVKYKSPYGNIELIGYLDDRSNDFIEFLDTKTGTGKWTQKKAEKHGQLHFYYLLILLAHGTRAHKAYIQHLDTKLDEKEKWGRKLTGHIYTHEVYLEIGHELEIRRRIDEAVRGISQAYTAYLLEEDNQK